MSGVEWSGELNCSTGLYGCVGEYADGDIWDQLGCSVDGSNTGIDMKASYPSINTSSFLQITISVA